MMSDETPETFLWSGVSTGVKKSGSPDLALAYSSYPSTCAAVFTDNKLAAAPVRYARQRLKHDRQYRGLVVNSGIANAATGEQGLQDNEQLIEIAAERLGIMPDEVLPASTGHIGERLPIDRLGEGIPEAVDELTEDPEAFSEAILTTDTVTKVVSREIPGMDVRLCGIAKGAGMIRPDMATMLAFLFLDHPADPEWWQTCLSEAVDDSFNRITVDGQMSTNDTVYALASQRPDRDILDQQHPEQDTVRDVVHSVCGTLARKIVTDGEGATRFIRVHVKSAHDEEAAETVARSVAGSNLVKSAFYGGDPNWGRIYSAIGATGIDVDPGDFTITIDDTVVYGDSPAEDGELKTLRNQMQDEDEHEIQINLRSGDAESECWTCDLSPEYVSFNSDYHT